LVDKSHWLEVSLSVNGELAEAVAEVLSRFAPNGVVTETDMTYTDAEDVGTPTGPVRVYAYLPVDSMLEEKKKKLEEALWHLSQIESLPEPVFRSVADKDWVEIFKQNYHPIPIGERLLILPAWSEVRDTDRIPVRIDPSNAFGTGTHPSTQLSMELLENHTRPGKTVIDVGCGSGILTITALKLGASKVLAVDIDSAAVTATEENAANNGVQDNIYTGLGSVQEIKNGCFIIRQSPVVVANILAPIILRLFSSGLADLVEPGGILIVSGILVEQAAGIQQTALTHGLTLVEMRQTDDWTALAFQKMGI
jgi:ribosomal protein L11 methyltransferase